MVLVLELELKVKYTKKILAYVRILKASVPPIHSLVLIFVLALVPILILVLVPVFAPECTRVERYMRDTSGACRPSRQETFHIMDAFNQMRKGGEAGEPAFSPQVNVH